LKNLPALDNEHGFFKFIFVTGFFVLAFYAGIQFGIPYYKYTVFKTDAREFARINLGDMEKTKAQVFKRAQELGLPIEEKNIEASKSPRGTRIKASWSETVDILGIYQHTFVFDVDVEE